MADETAPRLIPTEDLEAWFRTRGITYRACGSQPLGFGHGQPQYRLHEFPAPRDDETMGLFCEWHTEDFFDVDSGPHVAIALRFHRKTRIPAANPRGFDPRIDARAGLAGVCASCGSGDACCPAAGRG